MPRNVVSKKPYRGVNVFLLAVTADAMGYESPYWLTYKQAEQLGGHVKKGEKSTLVVFWKLLEKQKLDESGKKQTDTIPLLRYYRVFNTDQCEGLDLSKLPGMPADEHDDLDFSPIQACENVLGHFAKSPPIYHDGHGRAYYKPMADTVHMPERERFGSVEEYYAVLFHELTHSTGHQRRLDRFGDRACAAFGSCDYSKEELVAEMGAAFLCGMCSIENSTMENSAAYIDGWRRRIQGDRKLVVQAAAQAQKAVDHILGE